MRQAGLLQPVASLPSPHGCGDFGPSAYKFINLIAKTGAKIWQILPLNPLGYGNSPYQPYSSKAFDELYISLELLSDEGLLPTNIKPFNEDADRIDYDAVRQYKMPYLLMAYNKFFALKKRGYYTWQKENAWVYNYAVFRALKTNNYQRLWTEWPKEQKEWIKNHKFDIKPFEKDINFTMWLQYIAYQQWMKLRKYANKKGVKIMGDIPIYVGIDSDDVWTNQDAFELDNEGNATLVAGVPPDYFSKTGQRWGNPIYKWDYLKKHNYDFWIDRLSYNSKLYDIIRIDHFRAFNDYYQIPASAPTAEIGEWVDGPGRDFFDTVLKAIPHLEIVAEDLGDLTPGVLELRDHYNFKGMKITEFTFNPAEKENWSREDKANMIIYTGTHDNETMLGWWNNQSPEFQQASVRFLMELGYHPKNDIIDNFLLVTFDSIADIAIIPTQDLLRLDNRARINTPGTIGSPNWEWKLRSFTEFEARLPLLTLLIDRSNR